MSVKKKKGDEILQQLMEPYEPTCLSLDAVRNLNYEFQFRN